MTANGLTYNDSCSGNALTEYYCANGTAAQAIYPCPNICLKGACANSKFPVVMGQTEQSQSLSDLVSGLIGSVAKAIGISPVKNTCTSTNSGNYFQPGSVTTPAGIYNDSCQLIPTSSFPYYLSLLTEYYCNGSVVGAEPIECNTCSNDLSACVQSPDSCTETNPGHGIYQAGSCYDNGSFTTDNGSFAYPVLSLIPDKYSDYCVGSDAVQYHLDSCRCIAKENRCPYGCADGACLSSANQTCTDINGTASNGIVSDTSHCATLGGNPTSQLVEYYCNGSSVEAMDVDCFLGCSNGACNSAPASCDPINGTNVPAGSVVYKQGGTGFNLTFYIASCVNNNTGTLQYQCNGSSVVNGTVGCPYGCTNGSCVQLGNASCISTNQNASVYVPGTTYTTHGNYSDYCAQDATSVVVFYCNGGIVANMTSACPAGTYCYNGACSKVISIDCSFYNPKPNGTWSDNGTLYTCQGKAVVTDETAKAAARPNALVDVIGSLYSNVLGFFGIHS